MTTDEGIGRGRAAFEQRAWADAYSRLSAADGAGPLEPDDLRKLAAAAFLIGRDDESTEFWTRACRELIRRDDHRAAARCGFWIAFGYLVRGELTLSAGWVAKARRLLEHAPHECAEQGLLALPEAIQRIHAGEYASALATVEAATALGERCGDTDLVAFARCVGGRALVRMGRVQEGMAQLDEVMVAVLADEVSPALAGDLYCTVIEGCQETFDLRRAKEWTAALGAWCDAQPDLVPYRGQCQVHRAEIMALHGSWADARDVAEAAYHQLAAASHPAAGAASYALADLHRYSGEYRPAESAYREASRWGREPQPGLALLRLAEGQVEAALAAIRRALAETADHADPARPPLLAAAAEIALAAGDIGAAGTHAEELARAAETMAAPLLTAMATQASGAVRCAAGDPPGALIRLRRAWRLWRELDAPYHVATVRVLLGVACRAAGDEDGAQLEFDAAATVFGDLGATADLARAQALAGERTTAGVAGLTVRECEVLRLVATGRSNRAIATELFLSEKTVARHVSNILTKLDLPSRSAATAHAFRHRLV